MQITRARVWSLHPLAHLCPRLPTCKWWMSAHGFSIFFLFFFFQPNNFCHIVFLSCNINNVHLTVNALDNYVSIELSFPEIFFFLGRNFPFSVSAEEQFFHPTYFYFFQCILQLFLILKQQQYLPVRNALPTQTFPQPVTRDLSGGCLNPDRFLRAKVNFHWSQCKASGMARGRGGKEEEPSKFPRFPYCGSWGKK